MSAVVEAQVVSLRAHPGWGPSRIVWQLERTGVEPLPGRPSVYQALVRHGLVEAKKRKRRREDYRRWERGRSMELWQMGVRVAGEGKPKYLARGADVVGRHPADL